MTKEELLDAYNGFMIESTSIEEKKESLENQIKAIKAQNSGMDVIIKARGKQLTKLINQYAKDIFPYKRGMKIKVKITAEDLSDKVFPDKEYICERKVKYVDYYLNFNNKLNCTIYLTDVIKVPSINGYTPILATVGCLHVTDDDIYNDNTFSRYHAGNDYKYSVNIEIVK